MAPVAEEGTFPDVDGRSLEGESYALPADFEGELNLVLLGFHREQQVDIDTWLPVGRRLENEYSDVRYYEIPVFDRLYRPVRPFIDNGMRRGVPDEAAQERTITLYLNVTAFRRSLDLPTHESIYALLVGRDGEVYWREGGRRTDQAERALADAIDEYLEKR